LEESPEIKTLGKREEAGGGGREEELTPTPNPTVN